MLLVRRVTCFEMNICSVVKGKGMAEAVNICRSNFKVRFMVAEPEPLYYMFLNKQTVLYKIRLKRT